MDFAEQNPRAGTLARPYDYFIDTLSLSLKGEAVNPRLFGAGDVRFFDKKEKWKKNPLTMGKKVFIIPPINQIALSRVVEGWAR